MSYFYLITSLPYLSLEQAPISEAAFQSQCEAQLTAYDREVVQALDQVPALDMACNNTFVKAWNDRETQLRNAIAHTRATKRQVDPSRVLRPHAGFDTLIADAVEDAWTQSTPLAREKALDELRWNLLDDLQGSDPFHFNVVLAYTLKRRLAARWASMDADAGWQTAQHIFEQQPAGHNRQHEPESAGQHAGLQTRGTHEPK